jgi:FkbM family methyltransferase
MIYRTVINLFAGGLHRLPSLESPVFRLLRYANFRPARGFRFRLFKAWAAGLSDGREVRDVRLPGGAWLVVDVRDWCGITYIEPRAIEPATTDYLLGRLRPGDVFVDIGANVGYYTAQAAATVGPAGRVIAFEPNPHIRSLLAATVNRNGFQDRVIIEDIALADGPPGTARFYISADPTNSGISSLTPWDGHLTSGRLRDDAVLDVPTRSFDDFVDENGIAQVDVVKIDVEGAETAVLRGMTKSLDRFRPRLLIVETARDSPAMRLLTDIGYCAQMIETLIPAEQWGNIAFEAPRL